LLAAAFSVAGFASTAASQSAPKNKPDIASPPAWVLKTPVVQGKICAVGTCGATSYIEDAKPCAADNARADLAKSISVQVQSVMIEETSNSESRVDSSKVSGVKGWVTDAVVTDAVVEEYWYDKDGKVSYMPGVTYALACIPKNKVSR
jgi:hypothetical protein